MCAEEKKTRAQRPFSLTQTGTLLRRYSAQFVSAIDTDAMTMVANLVKGHEAVVRTARRVVKMADDVDDQSTEDVVTQRLQIHEKMAWMLRSLLTDS